MGGLLFADDLALMAETADEIQNLLDITGEFMTEVQVSGGNKSVSVFRCQQENVIKEVKWRVAALTAKGQEVPDIVSGGDLMWNKAVIPAILYGSEVITYNDL